MRRNDVTGLFPGVAIGIGIIAATWVAVHGPGMGVPLLGASVVLGVAVLGADVWSRRQQRRTARPSWAAWLTAGGVVLASMILASGHPRYLSTLMPMAGAFSWVVLWMRPDGRGTFCKAGPTQQTGS